MRVSPDIAPCVEDARTLRFSPSWEARFVGETAPHRIQHFVVSSLVGLLIFNLFLVSDWFLLPDMRGIGPFIRLGLITPVELGFAYWIYKEKGRLAGQPNWLVEGTVVVTSLLPICSMGLIIDMSHSPLRTLAHAGFAPILVYCNIVQRLRFRSSLLLSTLILAAHGTLLLKMQGKLDIAVPPILLLNFVTAIFSLVSAYDMEYEERHCFVLSENERRLLDDLGKTNSDLDALTRSDALTGCANRRHAQEYLNRQISVSEGATALILLDVDHFKAYNDHYGHPAGDKCLQSVAVALKSVVPHDRGLVVRWGGEEFLAILGNADLCYAKSIAEAIRSAVAALNIPHARSTSASMVTVSVGVAWAGPSERSDAFNDRLLEQADCALYQAKTAGRNTVRIAAK